MSQNEHGLESTSVIDASMAVWRTSTCYAFMFFLFSVFHIQLGQILDFR